MTQGKKQDPLYQAQAILSRRDHSVAEIRQKLRRKGFSDEQIERALAGLQQQGLVDDRKFAVHFVEEVLRFRAVGSLWLRAKLRGKGIDSSIVDQVLEQLLSPAQEEKLLRQAARQWQASHRQHTSDHRRLARFLLSRGFRSDIISEFLGGDS